MTLDLAGCYAAIRSRDPRFDGCFYTAVTSTGIYCRPSCPAVTPRRDRVRFYRSAAAAQRAGFRACKRCRPDATPGSPEWNLRADVVGRAMRLIADGVVDREGVGGLADRLGYSPRQLHRQLVAELGAGPLALSRAQRAAAARVLVETTDLPFARVAFAAGFDSIRQFNDTVRRVFAATPTQLRRRAHHSGNRSGDAVTVRLPARRPFDAAGTLAFLAARAVRGLEEVTAEGSFRRSLALPHGTGMVELRFPGGAAGYVEARLTLDDLRDLAAAVARCRRLLDLDADPVAVDDHLREDTLLAPLVVATPGRRVPGTPDGAEMAVRALVGQQISVAAARTLTARLVATYGDEWRHPAGAVTHRFPAVERLAEADLEGVGLPDSRRRALRALAAALADGRLRLDPGTDRAEARASLLVLPGVGPWTAEYISMRALGYPDAFPHPDAALRRAVGLEGGRGKTALLARADRWRPWRSYAVAHLWAASAPRLSPVTPIGV